MKEHKLSYELESLPVEIIHQIILSVDSKRDLRNLALSSKLLYDIVCQQIEEYRNIVLDYEDTELYADLWMKEAIAVIKKDTDTFNKFLEKLPDYPDKMRQLAHYDFFDMAIINSNEKLIPPMVYMLKKIIAEDNKLLLAKMLQNNICMLTGKIGTIYIPYIEDYAQIYPTSLKCRKLIGMVNLIFATDYKFKQIDLVLDKFPELINMQVPNSKFLQVKIPNNNFLHIAAKHNNKDILKKVLHAGHIDPNSQNAYGYTALHMAVLKQNVEIVSLLLKDKRIDINIQTSYGYTALHLACYDNNEEIVKILLKSNDINLSLHDVKQNTPIDIVKNNKKYTSILSLLKKKKKKIDRSQWRDRKSQKSKYNKAL